jgi:hypothetical protein
MTTQVHNYIQYILFKFYVFDSNSKLVESNTINDTNTIIQKISKIQKLDKATTTALMLTLSKNIFTHFQCFPIGNFTDIINPNLYDVIYLHYKQYKSNNIRETETYLKFNDVVILPKKTFTFSFEHLDTDHLVNIYGIHTRYNFEFITKSKSFVFVIDKSNIITNTNNTDIVESFKHKLQSCC